MPIKRKDAKIKSHLRLCERCGKRIKTTKYGKICKECTKHWWIK